MVTNFFHILYIPKTETNKTDWGYGISKGIEEIASGICLYKKKHGMYYDNQEKEFPGISVLGFKNSDGYNTIL